MKLSSLDISAVTAADAGDLAEVGGTVRLAEIPEFPPHTQRMCELELTYPSYGRRVERFLARLDGEPVGHLMLSFSELDNLNNVYFELEVAPEHRRRGIGTRLFELVLQRAREAGRTNLMAGTTWSLPGIPAHDTAGVAFAEKLGFAKTLPEVMRRLDLATLDESRLSEMLDHARAKAAGYRLVQWTGPAPEEFIDDIAYLDSRLLADAPMGDLALEPEKVDAERLRKSEAVSRQREKVAHHTGAVHEETGKLVAWTTIEKSGGQDPADAWHAWQEITIVEPRHRGHRLGALVKVENLRFYRAAQPGTKKIDTFNADENSYMVSINEDMGYRKLYAFINWQRDA